MLKTPTLLLNESICQSNIHRMAAKAQQNQVVFRPHFKTHQSHTIGAWFRAEGVDCITVSSLEMAQYFAQDGWTDITVAFPTNILEIDRINELANKIQLNLLIESLETIQFLATHLSAAIHVFLKIDLGYGRTGIETTNFPLINAIIEQIEDCSLMNFSGFLGHAGHSYQARGLADIKKVHEESMRLGLLLKQQYLSKYPSLILSVGDTPTCSRMDDFKGADELRPGNFVFYDLMQHFIGSNTIEEIAVAMACPIVAIHPSRNEVLIYGGGAHFSKDRVMNQNGLPIFGLVVENTDTTWGKVIEGAYVKKLSQEHGTVYLPDPLIQQVKIGQILKILPVHSCMTANLMKNYRTTKGEIICRL